MGLLHGVTVELQVLTQTGEDPFHAPVYAEEWVSVENVLIAPANSSEIIDTQDLAGRKAIYTLAIPKEDSHVWENRLVRFFGETWKVIGKPLKGIEALIPLDWNMKVQVDSLAQED